MTTEALEQAFATTRSVLANVRDDQLDDTTPCASWKVRDLVNHIVGGSVFFGQTMDAGEGSPPGDDVDFATGDRLGTYDEGVQGTVRAFNEPGAMEKTVKLPFGEFPGAAWMNLAATDTFVHGWDLAKATGQSTDLDPELATQLLESARTSVPDQFRGEDGVMPFGPQVDPPASASPADKLAAFLGRDC